MGKKQEKGKASTDQKEKGSINTLSSIKIKKMKYLIVDELYAKFDLAIVNVICNGLLTVAICTSFYNLFVLYTSLPSWTIRNNLILLEFR